MTIFPKELCPKCGQSIKGVMFGVYFTPARYRILKLIHDKPGIQLHSIKARLYPHSGGNGWRVILATITAINYLLEDSGYKVIGPNGGSDSGYKIVMLKD